MSRVLPLITHGNSITHGYGIETPYAHLLSGFGRWDVRERGHNGYTTDAVRANLGTDAPELATDDPYNKVIVFFEGTNDFIAEFTVEQVQGYLATYCAAVLALKWELWLCTTPPVFGGAYAGINTNLAELNTHVRNNWESLGASLLVDLAALTEWGSADYYQEDQLHPNQAGAQLIANAVSAAAVTRRQAVEAAFLLAEKNRSRWSLALGGQVAQGGVTTLSSSYSDGMVTVTPA
jgi:trimeric autotransporter adhesin